VAWPIEVSPATVSIMGRVRLFGPPTERSLDSSVLVTEGVLQVEDVLAVTLEAEVSRLNDAACTGAEPLPHDLLSSTRLIVHDADDGGLTQLSAPGVVAGPV